MKTLLQLAVSTLVLAGATSPLAQQQQRSAGATGLQPVSAFASIGNRDDRAAALFTEAGKVLQHPRCVNCHPRTDRPLQGDAMTLHQPPVTRGKTNHGAVAMECSTCHGSKNFELTPVSSMPGHENWHVAPREMAWEGKTLGEICAQIKDRNRNGGKSMAQMVEHMAHDSLVGWGWHPGAGRTPAPGTQAQFGELIRAWADAGAACPK
jgi:hypothetical protein